MRNIRLLFFSVLLTLGCSKSADKPVVLFKDQRQALDNAKDVEKTIHQQAQTQRENIDEATQK